MTKKLSRWIPLTCDYLAAKQRGPSHEEIHAVELSLKPPYGPVLCGADVPRLVLYGVRTVDQGGRRRGTQAMPWPPPAKGFGDRCRTCWEATGKKRSDPTWKAICIDAPGGQ